MSKITKITSYISYSSHQRLNITLLWAVIVLILSFLLLVFGIVLFGRENFVDPPENILILYQLVITLYTLIPAIVALGFCYKFRTRHYYESGIELPSNKLWLIFGLFYSFLVLIPTIITSILFVNIRLNFNYKPLTSIGFTTNNFFIDLLFSLVVLPILLIFSYGGFIRIIGEEYGWRGYLLPEFIKSHESIKLLYGVLLTGFIWTVYHVPFFTFLSPLTLSLEEMLFSLVGSFGVFFGATFAMAWAYLKTHNLWPALSLHYLWNILNPQITGNVYSNSTGFVEGTLWLINGEGLIGGMFHLIIGFGFLFLIYKDKERLLKEHDDYIEQINVKYSEFFLIQTDKSKQQKYQNKKNRSKRKKWDEQILR